MNSSKEGGTLLQLKNIINRRNIGKDISGKVNEVEDFLELVINCRLIAAALHFFSMESVSDTPHSNGFSSDICHLSLPEHMKIFHSRMEKIINNYIISMEFMATVLSLNLQFKHLTILLQLHHQVHTPVHSAWLILLLSSRL